MIRVYQLKMGSVFHFALLAWIMNGFEAAMTFHDEGGPPNQALRVVIW